MNIFDSKIIIYSILCELDITLKKNQHDCLTNDIWKTFLSILIHFYLIKTEIKKNSFYYIRNNEIKYSSILFNGW